MATAAHIKQLAKRYPEGCKLTPTQRVKAYYAIGRLMPKKTGIGARAGVYGKGVVEAFAKAWKKAGGMVIGRTTLRLCRQVFEAFSGEQIEAAVRARVSWRIIRELVHSRVPRPLRRKLLGQVCRGKMTAGEVTRRLDAQCRKARPQRRPKDLGKAAGRIVTRLDAVQKSIEGLAGTITGALDADKRAAESVIGAVDARLKACRKRWRDEVRKARRIRQK